MNSIPFIDIHTHSIQNEPEIIIVQNIYPGEGFAAFSGRNFYSVGLHPWHIRTADENNELLIMVEDALEFDHVIFIGECGLDKRVETDFSEQMRVFEAQAFIAEEFDKPLIIHCVKAYNEVFQLHKKMHPQMPWILHGYNGSVQNTKQLVDENFLFSFGETLFNTNAKGIESFKYLPLDKLFLETDEFNGHIQKLYKQGADLKNISVDSLKEVVYENFNRIENINVS